MEFDLLVSAICPGEQAVRDVACRCSAMSWLVRQRLAAGLLEA
jgi:hypothetical protein